jgi:endonuclease/exonuclease/phosphatase family metal-dependent hydrolase
MKVFSKPLQNGHTTLVLALVLALGFVAISFRVSAAENAPALKVMTYNLRYASETPPNAWPDRLPLVIECVRQAAPDVMGTQEGLYGQLKDLARGLPEYDWIGLGRDGGSKGEFMAVFFRKSRLEPLAYDHFWLSDTPEVIASTTWGNSNRRMVTWVRFLDRETKKQFVVLNTHFDHQVQPAREKSAELIRKRVVALEPELPLLLIGDFNAGQDNKAYELLVGDGFFQDTWPRARVRRGEDLGTFNGFKAVPRGGTRIDWILMRGGWQVESAAVIDFAPNGQFPSDHYPVAAELRFP